MATTSALTPYFGAAPVQRTKDLERAGLSRTNISRLVREGQIIRLRRGVYCLPDYRPSENGDLLVVAKRSPEALLCLLTALRIHGLTTQIPAEIWIGLPGKARAPRLEYPALRVIRYSSASLGFGVETRIIEGLPVRVTTVEKTIADCFKYRSRVGLDVAIEALREATRTNRLNRDALWACAKTDRVTSVIRPYLEAVT